MKVYEIPRAQGEDLLAGQMPPTQRKFARAILRPGDTVLDIGAADGTYTRAYADLVGPTGFVMAVEPHPMSMALLRERVSQYPGCGHVVVWNGAVGAETGIATLHEDCDRHKRSSLWPNNVPVRGVSFDVLMTTVDALVAEMPQIPRLIKVDAQGAEAQVLAGAPITLGSSACWVLELWPMGLANAGTSVVDVLRRMRALGFHPFGKRLRPWPWSRLIRDAQTYTGHTSIDVLFVPEASLERLAHA